MKSVVNIIIVSLLVSIIINVLVTLAYKEKLDTVVNCEVGDTLWIDAYGRIQEIIVTHKDDKFIKVTNQNNDIHNSTFTYSYTHTYTYDELAKEIILE